MAATIADKLDEARNLIERGWAQGEYALDASGRGLFAFKDDPFQPVKWSASGALRQVGAGGFANRAVIRAAGGRIVDWSDAPERTQAEVVEVFRKAAELARQGASA